MFTKAEQIQVKEHQKEISELQHEIDLLKKEHHLTLSRFIHELRNPLTLIKSTAQLIETQHPEIRDYKYWDDLLIDIDDTVTLLNQLSFYNHCDDNLHKKEESLIDLITRCVSSFSPMADSNEIDYLFFNEIEPNTDLEHYPCDSVKLRQAFTNLLKNALEATPKGGTLKVVLSLKKNLSNLSNNNPYISISIENSGETISEDMMQHIFEPFVTSKPEGTGIGLPITRKIIESHQGFINVTSNQHTTCFEVLLPHPIHTN